MRRSILALLVLALLFTRSTPLRAQTDVMTLQASQVAGIVATTITRSQRLIGTYSYYTAHCLLNITAGGTATGALTIFVQDSADGGTTWDDVISSNSFAFGAAAITQHFFLTFDTTTTATQGAAAQQEALAAGTVRNGPIGNLLRVREKVTGPSGSPVGPTYTMTCVFK